MARVYDYIVVGAGSAGCVLAARLSENPATSVLLIEAGGRDWHPFFKMPLAWLRATTLTRHLWTYRSEPEAALGGRSFPFVRGRVLGGTSTINGMIYARGHRLDYDDWASKGLPEWSYKRVLPWFKRLENNWRGTGPLHGESGPVGVTRPDVPGMHFNDWARAASAIGIETVNDLAEGDGEGISLMELTVAKGMRVSSASAYLAPAAHRPNLTVLTKAAVQRIVVDGGSATGVEILTHIGKQHIACRREVILSAGTYGSPQLLMLSGIGPGGHLRDRGIDVKADLPGVGRHLKEHVILPVGFRAAHDHTFLSELRLDRAAWGVMRWVLHRKGPFATNGVGGNIYVRSHGKLDRPDLRLICGTVGPLANLWTPWQRNRPLHEFMCVVNLLHPESEGSVTLRSASPADAPIIHFNLLKADADRRSVIEGIRIARRLLRTDPLKQHVAEEWTPGESAVDDAALDAHVRRMAAIGQHPVGTCRMGTGQDAVVDQFMKVKGVDGLRVVDASVFPDQIGGNPNVPVMMIAERAAHFMASGR